MTTKKDTPTPAVHWVDEYLVPLGACDIPEYRQYPDAQTAWEKCEDPHHLLWTLDKTKVCDDRTFRRMACDFAEHVLHVFEEKYPTDNRPRDAIAASRAYAESPTAENRLTMSAAREAAEAAECDAAEAAARDVEMAATRDATGAATGAAAWAAAREVAWAAVNAAVWGTGMAAAWAAARDVAMAATRDATGAATGAAAWAAAREVAWAAVNAAVWGTGMAAAWAAAWAAAGGAGMAAENRWQCDCIRKYFPKFPFVGAAIKKAKGETE